MVANSTAIASGRGVLSRLPEEDGAPYVLDRQLSSPDTASPWGKFAGVAAAAMTVAILPDARSLTFTPKFAIVLVIAAVGFVPFLRSVRFSRAGLPSLFLLGFLLLALVASFASVAPVLSIIGLYTWGTGWLLWLGCVGAYGIGLQLRSKADQDWLFFGLVTGAGVNAALALYQTLARPTSIAFGPYQANQAQGLLGNPIYLEALLLGIVALVLVRVTRSTSTSTSWQYLALLVLLSMGLEFSDERFAVLILPFLLGGILLWRRRAAFMPVCAVVVGYVGGYFAAGSSLAGRLAAGTSSVGFGDRLRIWKIAIHAFLTHPLLGYGPGLFEAATAPRMTARLARDLGATSLFTDAHDLVIEVMVTTGVVGLLLFAGWLVTAAARVRNYLVLFALCALAVELIEPVSLALTPLVFLFLAASQRQATPHGAGLSSTKASDSMHDRLTVPFRVLTAVLVLGALAAGTTMVVGDLALAKAPPGGYVLRDAKRASLLLPYWPQSAEALGTLYNYRAITGRSGSTAARRALQLTVQELRSATKRDSFDPLVYASLGNAESELQEWSAASSTYRRGLRNDPWSQANLDGLATVFAHRHEWVASLRELRRELEALRPGYERSIVERSLDDVRHRRLPAGPIS